MSAGDMTITFKIKQDRQAQRRIIKKFDGLKNSKDRVLIEMFEKEILSTIRVEIGK